MAVEGVTGAIMAGQEALMVEAQQQQQRAAAAGAGVLVAVEAAAAKAANGHQSLEPPS